MSIFRKGGGAMELVELDTVEIVPT